MLPRRQAWSKRLPSRSFWNLLRIRTLERNTQPLLELQSSDEGSSIPWAMPWRLQRFLPVSGPGEFPHYCVAFRSGRSRPLPPLPNHTAGCSDWPGTWTRPSPPITTRRESTHPADQAPPISILHVPIPKTRQAPIKRHFSAIRKTDRSRVYREISSRPTHARSNDSRLTRKSSEPRARKRNRTS